MNSERRPSHCRGRCPFGTHSLLARLSRHIMNCWSGQFGVAFKRAESCFASPPSQGHSIPAKSKYHPSTTALTLPCRLSPIAFETPELFAPSPGALRPECFGSFLSVSLSSSVSGLAFVCMLLASASTFPLSSMISTNCISSKALKSGSWFK